MSVKKYDYVVIGSGPGGYVSAIRASQLGLKTLILEKERIGGICLNWGCIPTKALLESAHFYSKTSKISLGIEFKGKITPKLDQIVDRSRKIAEQLSRGVDHLLKKYKVECVKGRGYISDPHHVKVFDPKNDLIQEVEAKYICIATGARAKELPNMKFSKNIVSYKEAMLLKSMPKNLLIIGAGAIGCEFSDFFSCLGSRVTLAEAAEHILPAEESFLAIELKKSLEKKGIQIYEKASVTGLAEKAGIIKAIIQQGKDKKNMSFDKVLLAVGIKSNLENIGLENIDAKVENDRIKTNSFRMLKEHPNIFAIGDIATGKQLAHKASREGVIAAEKAAGKNPQPLEDSNVPSCVYTSPQVASIGFTASQLKSQNIPYKEGNFPFIASGKALALGDTTGFTRTYIHKTTGEILGAHFLGEDVTELISNISLARAGELTSDEISYTIFPHPTLAETVFESVEQALGKSTNY